MTNQSGETPFIFLSHKSEDRQKVNALAETIERKGLRIWWSAKLLPGEIWPAVIDEKLKAASCVLVVWTNRSILSNWVQSEARFAYKERKLIPVLLEKCTIPLEFSDTETADLADWYGESDHYDLKRLIKSLDKFADAPLKKPTAEPPFDPIVSRTERFNTPWSRCWAPVSLHTSDQRSKIRSDFLSSHLLHEARRKLEVEIRREVKRKSEIRAKYYEVYQHTDTHQNRRALRDLVLILFKTVPGFKQISRHSDMETENIDLVFENESDQPHWRNEGSIILVECHLHRVDQNEIVLFREKMETWAGRCAIGFLVCADELAETVSKETLRSRKTNLLVVPVDGVKLRQLVETGDRSRELRHFLDQTLFREIDRRSDTMPS